MLSNNSLDQTEAVDKAIREADRVKLLTSNKLLSFDLWGRPLELLGISIELYLVLAFFKKKSCRFACAGTSLHKRYNAAENMVLCRS